MKYMREIWFDAFRWKPKEPVAEEDCACPHEQCYACAKAESDEQACKEGDC